MKKFEIIPASVETIIVEIMWVPDNENIFEDSHFEIHKHQVIGWVLDRNFDLDLHEHEGFPVTKIMPISPTLDLSISNSKTWAYLRPDGKLDDVFNQVFDSVEDMERSFKDNIKIQIDR